MIENREKSWFRRTDALIAAFVVPVLIMVIIYAERGIFPFGNRAYLRTDLYHQYAPFMSEFQYKLSHAGSLLYSWDVGMGVNFSALYAYYLASPLNWLVVLAPKAYLIEFISIMIILKTGLAGLTMTVYLGKHTKNSTFAPAFFGIFYALSGYLAAYSWNIMWLDCIVLLPLICLGLEKLVNEKRGLLYAVTLAVSILSNYYISIMICIFMVLYFIVLLILKGKQSFGSLMGTAAIFAGYSLLAGALAAVVWLPEIYALQYTASEDMTFPKAVSEYFSIIDELARHMVNVATEQTLDHWPNVYCGVAVFPLVILYIANRKISLKEKIVYCVMAVLFLASFSLNILSFVWHGLHYPNSLPARQSFIYIWMILFMCYREVDEIEGTHVRDIAVAAIASIAFVFLCQCVVKDDAFTWSVWYLTMGFVSVYCLIMYLYRAGKLGVNLATFIVLGLCAIEAATNMTLTGINTTSRDQYIANNNATIAVVDYVKDDRDFYRFEKTDRKAKDDGAWMNFHTVSLFSSMAHEDISNLFKHLGCEASTNAYCIIGSTPLVDALFDIKYAIYTGYDDNPHDTIVCESGEIRLYQNEFCLPLGFMLPDNLETSWAMDMGNPVLVQNQLGSVLNAGKVLEQVDGFSEGSAYTFTAPEDGLYYAYSENSQTGEMKVTIGDTEKTFEKVDRGYFIELGWLPKNTIVYLEAKDDTATMVHAYRFNYATLKNIVDQLGAQPMEISTYDDTHIYAGIDVSEAGKMATTIPYDPGWTVRVDGNIVPTGKFLDSFISIELTSGHHDIEFTYMPEGVKNGTLATAASLAILFIIFMVTLIVDGVRRRKADSEDDGGHKMDGGDGPGSDDGPAAGTVDVVTSDIQDNAPINASVNATVNAQVNEPVNAAAYISAGTSVRMATEAAGSIAASTATSTAASTASSTAASTAPSTTPSTTASSAPSAASSSAPSAAPSSAPSVASSNAAPAGDVNYGHATQTREPIQPAPRAAVDTAQTAAVAYATVAAAQVARNQATQALEPMQPSPRMAVDTAQVARAMGTNAQASQQASHATADTARASQPAPRTTGAATQAAKPAVVRVSAADIVSQARQAEMAAKAENASIPETAVNSVSNANAVNAANTAHAANTVKTANAANTAHAANTVKTANTANTANAANTANTANTVNTVNTENSVPEFAEHSRSRKRRRNNEPEIYAEAYPDTFSEEIIIRKDRHDSERP